MTRKGPSGAMSFAPPWPLGSGPGPRGFPRRPPTGPSRSGLGMACGRAPAGVRADPRLPSVFRTMPTGAGPQRRHRRIPGGAERIFVTQRLYSVFPSGWLETCGYDAAHSLETTPRAESLDAPARRPGPEAGGGGRPDHGRDFRRLFKRPWTRSTKPTVKVRGRCRKFFLLPRGRTMRQALGASPLPPAAAPDGPSHHHHFAEWAAERAGIPPLGSSGKAPCGWASPRRPISLVPARHPPGRNDPAAAHWDRPRLADAVRGRGAERKAGIPRPRLGQHGPHRSGCWFHQAADGRVSRGPVEARKLMTRPCLRPRAATEAELNPPL